MRRRVEGAGMFRRASVELREEDGDDVAGAIAKWLQDSVDDGGFGFPKGVAELLKAGEAAIVNAPPGGWRVLGDPEWWLAEIALEHRYIELGEAEGNFDMVKRSAFQLGILCDQLQTKILAEPSWHRVRVDVEKRRAAQREATKARMAGKPGNAERAAAVDAYRARHPGASIATAARWLSLNQPELGTAETIRKAPQKLGDARAKYQK